MNDYPWSDEPDALDWISEHGYPCAIRRVEWSGHLCGYVGIPVGHPWHDTPYSDIDAMAHGGLTFGGREVATKDLRTGDPDTFWIGFDCAHAGDLSPKDAERERTRYLWGDAVYRNIGFVRYETEQLARQVAERIAPAALAADIAEWEAEIVALQARIASHQARLGNGPGLAPTLAR